jgi:hypothetical protein
MSFQRFVPVLIGLGVLAAVPAQAGFARCGLGSGDTDLSSPVTFAEFCGSSFNAVLQSNVFFSPNVLDTSSITGIQFDVTVDSVTFLGNSFTPAPVDFFFGDVVTLGDTVANKLSNPCQLTVTGPGDFSTGLCTVSQVDDTAFLAQLATGHIFVALAGANGVQSAVYSDATLTIFSDAAAAVPEPAAAASLATGLLALYALRRTLKRG